jgi:alkylation response protein AidB-like acyl-CoA dehydrogenase
VRTFVERQADRDHLVALQDSPTGYDPAWVPAMAEAGWLGLLVPPEAGGGGATALETAVVFEELGRGPVPGPFFSSSVLAALLLGSAEPTDRRDERLGAIATGRAVVAVALAEPGRSWAGWTGSTLALGSDGRLSGIKSFVPYAGGATHLLIGIRDAGGQPAFALVERDAPGVTVRPLPGFSAGHHLVELAGVMVEDADLYRPPDDLDERLAPALAVRAAYQVGGCATLLDRSVDYSRTRVQFGMPIGRFQRVQDHVVRIVNALDTARWTTYEALWRIDSGRPARGSAHLAAAVASESYFEAADAAHEVHAGIGSDPQFGLTLFTRQSRSLFDELGSPAWHRRQMAEALEWAAR